MNSFYQSIFDNIQALRRAGKAPLALAVIEQELSIPYVPEEIAARLEELRKEIESDQPQPVPDSAMRLDSLINGSPAAKEKAVAVLQTLNLRNYHDQVQKLLNDPMLLDEFKGELIRELIRQRIEEPFSISKDGLDFEFVPSLITPDYKDPTLVQVRKLFEDWLGGSFVLSEDFAGQLLEQEVLETLPLSFEEVDPRSLAASIVRLVYISMKDEAGWKTFARDHNLEQIQLYPLKIEKRGE